MRNRLALIALSLWLAPMAGAVQAAFPWTVTIPVITDARGAAGERFRTVISVSNKGATNVALTLLALPEKVTTCDRDPYLPSFQELTPGATVTFSAEAFLELIGASGTGFLEVVPSGDARLPDVSVQVRLFAQTGNGTYGQEIPVIRSDEAPPPAGVPVHLIGLKRTPQGSRTNLLVFVPTSACGSLPLNQARITVSSRWSSGEPNAPSKEFDVPIGGLVRVNDVFARLGAPANCPDCRLVLTSPTTFHAFASVVEEGTSDPTLVTGEFQ